MDLFIILVSSVLIAYHGKETYWNILNQSIETFYMLVINVTIKYKLKDASIDT